MDYSPYRYDYRVRKNKPRTVSGQKSVSKATKPVAELVLLFVMIGGLIAALVLANFWSGGEIVSAFKNGVSSGDYIVYYTVIHSSYPTENEAKAQAAVIRAGGGAGYIILRNSTYSVALATFIDKADAQAVMDKNGAKEIAEGKLDRVTFAENGGDKELAERVLEEADALVKKLGVLVEQTAKGEKSVASALAELTPLRNSMLNLKAELTDGKRDEELRQKLLSVVEPCFGGLDAVVAKGSARVRDFAAELRYVQCSVAVAITALGD